MPMPKDPLANEVSIKAGLTPTGVTLRAKSRLFSAVDRIGGTLVEFLNGPLEEKTAARRARIDLLEAAKAAAIKKVKADPDLATQFIAHMVGAAVPRADNKLATLEVAFEELLARPPDAGQASSGDEQLSPEFLDRFDRYAEDASTDDLRAKWGKVLAAEIRRPGHISRRTMRAVDEMPAAVAIRLEQICAHRLSRHLVRSLVGELSFADATMLSSYDLIVDPGLTGQIAPFQPVETTNGPRWMMSAEGRAICLLRTDTSLFPDRPAVLRSHNNAPALPVYVLTDVGFEIASIFEHDPETVWQALVLQIGDLANDIGPFTVEEFRDIGGAMLQFAEHSFMGKPAS